MKVAISSQAMPVTTAVEFCQAGQAGGLDTDFSRKCASMGHDGEYMNNAERDFLRDARKRLGVKFQSYIVHNLVRSATSVTTDASIGMLLPYEVAHWLWCQNPAKFHAIFPLERIVKFWERAIEDQEQWFTEHPMCDAICAAEDKSVFLPVHIFGDDGTLKKSRVFGTVTWFCGLFSKYAVLDSRVPCYVVPRHILVKDYTENKMQEAICWAFEVWLTGKFPRCNHLGQPWPANSIRAALAENNQRIAGGHIAVYVNTTADQMWAAQHFRYATMWSSIECCHRCGASTTAGPLHFMEPGGWPLRTTSEYLDSEAGRSSPLSKLPGFVVYSLRGEAMHAGPLGSLPDVVGSCLLELCQGSVFGDFADITVWKDKLQAQLDRAYDDLSAVSKSTGQEHTIKRFTRASLSMNTLSSWPYQKGKAHNILVAARWLEHVCRRYKDCSEYAGLRWMVVWGWVEWFDVRLQSDPDFLEPSELERLDKASKTLIYAHKLLARTNSNAGLARWKIRQKLHVMHHINCDAQSSRRNPRAWWSFKEEECMGCLSKIACATHALTLTNRSLERWCVQFFNSMLD